MAALRALAVTAAVLVAVVLQVSVFPYLSVQGVAPNLALLLVVAVALVRGADLAAVIGFLAGLAIDLAPPADHVAGRWALALMVVGYLAGRVRRDARTSALAVVVTVAACSFVATSLYALAGMVLHDPDLSAMDALRVIVVSVGYDVLLTPFVLPLAMRLFRRPDAEQTAY